MSRIVWKGAISFGLAHIPVALRTGTGADDLDFNWLDKRDMARIEVKIALEEACRVGIEGLIEVCFGKRLLRDCVRTKRPAPCGMDSGEHDAAIQKQLTSNRPSGRGILYAPA